MSVSNNQAYSAGSGITLTGGQFAVSRPIGIYSRFPLLAESSSQAVSNSGGAAATATSAVSTEANTVVQPTLAGTETADTTTFRRLLRFSKLANIQGAFFTFATLTCGTNNDTNHAVLYDATHSVAISDVSTTSTAARTWTGNASPDITGSLPTLNSQMTLYIYDSGGHRVDVCVAGLDLYW